MEILVAAIWGFCGAVPYAGTKLVTALWSGAEVDQRAKRLAFGQFLISMFTGPVAAASLAPWLVGYARGASLEAVAVAVGLFSNAAWPILTDRTVVARFLTGLGGWIGRSDNDHPGPRG